MAVQNFSDIYLGQCDNCGADLEDWEWLSDELFFHTTCPCGNEYTLEPTVGVLEREEDDILDSDEDENE